jgi:hypothetical protein
MIEEAFMADFAVVRALLKRGRSYEQAVRSFEPYGAIHEIVEVARRAIRKKQPAYVYVNNRLEGNAPSTIEAVLDGLAE